ncbi:hypothetical protein [Spirochaeta thermophila]|uniref:Uncharacterized protein n=2 Tax=Winmispira thermophila TaxID=154 RepID=G0GCF0_WINT7|nr:hypothetical protein [Spirochaeta thermophila]ADN01883.1 hypothetical protein STHERM_c09360 [Spirochaeta thermophila DSM 6192]AEJ61235.1 hypothetical protein Spith_0961 [Spirochaeta thermophila DSM 6578]
MALHPIDLQTMFTRLHEVGREQGGVREIPVHHQTVQGEELVKRAQQESRSVNETRQVGEGVEKVKEEKGREQGQGKGRSKEEREASRRATSSSPEVVEDPDIGRHVDLLG